MSEREQRHQSRLAHETTLKFPWADPRHLLRSSILRNMTTGTASRLELMPTSTDYIILERAEATWETRDPPPGPNAPDYTCEADQLPPSASDSSGTTPQPRLDGSDSPETALWPQTEDPGNEYDARRCHRRGETAVGWAQLGPPESGLGPLSGLQVKFSKHDRC